MTAVRADLPNPAGFTTYYIDLYRIGKLGICDYYVANTTSFGDVAIFTFPDGFRPNKNSYKYGSRLEAQGDTVKMTQTLIRASDNIFRTANNGLAQVAAWGHFAYLIAD